ncbi:hypothetical protein STENM327S_06092 [Streptomyces tendae]
MANKIEIRPLDKKETTGDSGGRRRLTWSRPCTATSRSRQSPRRRGGRFWFPGPAACAGSARPGPAADPDAVRGRRAAPRPGRWPWPHWRAGGRRDRAGAGGAGGRRGPAVHGDRTDAVTWDVVLCLDPDGAALSEGLEAATAGPGHPLDGYYRAAFRPVAAEQPEWAPIEGRRMPESRALLDAIDELRPVLQCSLHSVDVGGTWVQLTRDLPGLAAPFRAFAASEVGVPVQHGTYDALYWENPAPGIHVLPRPDSTARLAAGSENVGRSTWCAPQAYEAGCHGDRRSPPVGHRDGRRPVPAPGPGRGPARAVRAGAGGRPAGDRRIRQGPGLPAAGRGQPAQTGTGVDGRRPVRPGGRRLGAPGPAGGGRGAPRRDLTPADDGRDQRPGGRRGARQPLRAGGAPARLLLAADDPAATGLPPGAGRNSHHLVHEFESSLRLRWVPVSDQVELQARTVLAAAECALER